MAKTKTQKYALAEEIKSEFSNINAALISEYRGAKAEDLASLRRSLRLVGCEFKVIKNRIAKKAIMDDLATSGALAPILKGPIGVVYVKKDIAKGAKALLEFAKDHQEIQVVGGVMDGKSVTLKDIQAISDLPSKEVLIARMLGSLTSPHRGLMYVLKGVSEKLVRVVGAIKDTKS